MDRFAYISVVFAFLAGMGLGSMYFSNLSPEVTVDNNVSAPEISQTHNIEPPRYNYIQANNHQVNYSWETEGVVVEDVDLLINTNGLSMRPTIFTGHTLLATKYENQLLEEGTIISANNVTHRIAGDYTDTSGYYSTRGDNNRGSEKVKPKEIDHVIIGTLYTDK